MDSDGHVSGMQGPGRSRARVRPPASVEGRVPDRGNPAPLDRVPPGSVVATQVLALGPALGVGVLLAPHGLPVWVIPAVVAVVVLALTVRWREISVLERLVRRPRPAAAEPQALPVDLPDGTTLGVIRDGRLLVSVLSVREDTPVVSVTGTRPPATVPVGLLVDHLSRYDIDLHSIDVVVSAPGDGHGARTAWITLRFDPALDPDAVGRRGGGDAGAVRSLVTVTRLLALRLGGEGLAVTPLDPAGLSRDRARVAAPVATSVVAGVTRLDALTADHPGIRWISLRGGDRAGRIYWCAATTVPEGTDAPDGTVVLDAAAGGDVSSLAPGGPGIGARSALRPHLDDVAALTALSPVLDGSGVLLGVDVDGRAVRLGLHGRARHVALIGSDHTARQIVLRALRGGTVVEVVTDDAARWEPLRGPGHALVLRHPDDHPEPGWRPGLVVVVAATTVHDRDATILTVVPPGGEPPRTPVVLTEHAGEAAGSLTASVDGLPSHVGLVELPGEAAVIGRPVAARPA